MTGLRLVVTMSAVLSLTGCAAFEEWWADVTGKQQRSEQTASAEASAENGGGTWDDLASRFQRKPFSVDYIDEEARELVVTYSGSMGSYVACGTPLNPGDVSQGFSESSSGSTVSHLDSRMIIQSVGNNPGEGVSVDALHVLTIRSAGTLPHFVDVAGTEPVSLGDGRYCWSTGEMESLPQIASR